MFQSIVSWKCILQKIKTSADFAQTNTFQIKLQPFSGYFAKLNNVWYECFDVDTSIILKFHDF